jgi:hypothetical protein
MNLLTRTRDQLILGVWALAPVAVVVLLFLTWPHVDDGSRYYTPYSPGYSTPLTTWRLLELLGTIALVVVAAGMLLGDLWRRPLPRGLRKVWTVVILLGAPFGGLAYWLLHCHGGATPTVSAAETA